MSDQQGQSPEELHDHIEQTRQDLSTTIEALGVKLDVKSRVRAGASNAVARGRDAVTDEEGRPDRQVVVGAAGAAAVVVGVVAVIVWRRR